MQLAAGVHEEQVPISQQLVIAPVVDGECICPGRHYGRILRAERHVSESRGDSRFCRSRATDATERTLGAVALCS